MSDNSRYFAYQTLLVLNYFKNLMINPYNSINLHSRRRTVIFVCYLINSINHLLRITCSLKSFCLRMTAILLALEIFFFFFFFRISSLTLNFWIVTLKKLLWTYLMFLAVLHLTSYGPFAPYCATKTYKYHWLKIPFKKDKMKT